MSFNVEQIAAVCHEVNRAYCQALGDHSQPPWSTAPKWQRDSAIDGVRSIIDDPGISAEQSHGNWMRHKQGEGWGYGLVKNAEKKEHPCMVPYHLLPEEHRVKDHLFLAVVRAMLEVQPA